MVSSPNEQEERLPLPRVRQRNHHQSRALARSANKPGQKSGRQSKCRNPVEKISRHGQRMMTFTNYFTLGLLKCRRRCSAIAPDISTLAMSTVRTGGGPTFAHQSWPVNARTIPTVSSHHPHPLNPTYPAKHANSSAPDRCSTPNPPLHANPYHSTRNTP